MPDLSLARVKRTRLAQAFKHKVLRRADVLPPPLLSVVVPIYDASPYLAECLRSLVEQVYPSIEVIMVDDGSTDGSRQIAEAYAAEHPNFVLVSQSHSGIGAARNRGVAHATGAFLAFCDADDMVVPGGYDRMATALQASGSDLAIGSVAIQRYGRFQEPAWARRSNADRRLGAAVVDIPEIMANQIPGTRVFRRTFWADNDLRFATDTEHSDALLMVETMLTAGTIDVVPAVVYHWRWREDMRSLRQRDLRDKDRVTERIDSLCRAGRLLVGGASEQVQEHFFAEVLHTTIPDLVRAAVCRHDGYWEALSQGLQELMRMVSPNTLRHVPVEDRLIAWLCAHDERIIAEDFLEYAWDNKFGYPFRRVDGHPYIDLAFLDTVPESDAELVRVAEADMRYRTRLTAIRWDSPTMLHLEGAAFIEYLDDTAGQSEIHLLLRERHSGAEFAVETTRPVEPTVNEWADRAHEDHGGGGFVVDLDVGQLAGGESQPRRLRFDVSVRLRIAGEERISVVQSRQVNGSAGLLEVSTFGALEAEPIWREFRGLSLAIRPATDVVAPGTDAPATRTLVDEVHAAGEALRLSGLTNDSVEIALVGPRSRSEWATPVVDGNRFNATISVLVDEWGLGVTGLPSDSYRVMVRRADGSVEEAHGSTSLRRQLPLVVESGRWHFTPSTTTSGKLSVRLAPREVRASRPPYARRRLREDAYLPAREKPLLDVALFETFAAKAAGDNPGALCEEMARRDDGVELVFSVFDLSVVVPEGARAVVRWSPEWHELMARARYLIINAALPYFFVKRPDQTYLQTWHGTPLKRIAHDRPNLDFDNWHHRRQLGVATAGWDYLVSQSQFCSRALRSAFRYDGEVLELGYPRNDILSSPDAVTIRRRTREHLGLTDDQRVVLYAPTWRDNMRTGMVFNKVLYLDTHAVAEQVDGAVLLVRGHYNTIRAANSQDADERIVDVTRYPDISHLYLAADVLVTDYSSVFFDFVITDKPMVFLAPDLDHYRDETRGFYLDYHETVPGPVCETSAEVIAVLNGSDEYAQTRAEFRDRYAPLDDGRAAQRVLDAVFNPRSS